MNVRLSYNRLVSPEKIGKEYDNLVIILITGMEWHYRIRRDSLSRDMGRTPVLVSSSAGRFLL